jgi:predicted permease
MIRDLANAARQWLRTPVVTAVALASLALGIGANVALFGVVDALLLKSLPVRDPASLVRFVADEPRFGAMNLFVSSRTWEYLRDHQPFAGAVLAVASGRVNLARGGEARFVPAVYVSGTAMGVLGIEPVTGRVIAPDDDRETAPPVAMISYGLWQRDYAADPGAIGQTLWVTDVPLTIVGVAPPSFFGFDVGRRADVFLPLSADNPIRKGLSQATLRDDAPWLTLYARLRPGQSADDATTALRAWLPALREATMPDGPDAERHLAVPPYAVSGAGGVSVLRRQYQQPLFVLLAAVALVLLIACANLAAVVLARFSDRRHELGVRLALGANRARVIRMLLAESLLLAAAGAAIGIVLAQALAAAMVPYLATATGPGTTLPVAIDLRLIAYTTLVAIVSGGIAGLLPAWRASRVTPQVSLAATSRGGMHGRRATRSLRLMVAAQVGLSLVLVAGAAVMVRSFVGLTTNPTGVDTDRVLIAVVIGTLADPQPERRYSAIEEIRRSLKAVPGVEEVSGGIITPLSGGMAAARLEVPGSIYNPASPDGAMAINGRATTFTPFNPVLPAYFATVGTPILMGRDFDERDGPDAPPVAVVNQAFATRHFGTGNPIGRTIVTGGRTLEIVGLAADSKLMSLKDAQPIAMAYGAFTQLKTSAPVPVLRFAVRAGQPDTLRTSIANAIRAVDPRLSIEFRTMQDQADASVNRERLMAWLAAILAALGLAMAVLGLYGTFMYAVTRRRSEIGVRMAVGAGPGDILRMILREAAVVLAIGTAIGLAGALATARVLQGLLFSVSARDPWMLAAAIAAVGAAAAAASVIPARRASLTDPMVALREE